LGINVQTIRGKDANDPTSETYGRVPCVRVLQGMRWEEGWSGELLQGRAHGAERKAERRVEIDLSQSGIPKREICPGPSPLKVRDEKIQGQEKCDDLLSQAEQQAASTA
jgi:hypothetical protein